jgi:hypothetical protein
MDAKIAPESELSLLRGGPFYRAQLATGLIKEGEWNHTKRVIIAIAVGWVPLVLLTALFNRPGLASLLTSYRVYSRMLIAVPALLLGQHLMESRFRMTVQAIIDAQLLGEKDLKRMYEIIASLIRLRDSFIPEAMVVVLLVAHSITAFRSQLDIAPWLSYGAPPDIHLTAAGWYVIVVSTTIFQFLLGLSLWKWLLWTIFTFQLSRLDLNLVAIHPDGHGGLGFFGLVPVAFAPISFAAAAVIGSTWRHEILEHGAKLASFKLEAVVLAMIVAIIALGPLAFFTPRLAKLRRDGILDYGVLGQIQSTQFHDKWVRNRAGYEAKFLDAPESSTLTDYGASYANIEKLKPFPTDKAALLALAISIALPMLPVVLAVIPLNVVLEDLLKALR